MHVGEPVAMVVAVSAAAAQDAAEKVVVDYEPLTPVTDARAAIAPGAPQLWPDAPGNIGFDWTAPADPDGKKQAALDRAFKEAAHVVRVELVNQRLVVASLEPRTATASYDADSKQFTLRCGTQGVAACAARSPAPEHQAGGTARRHRRSRRRLRHEGLVLSGICRDAACRARTQAADPLGLDPLGSLRHRQSGPRFVLDRGARAQQARPLLGLRVDCLGNIGAYFTGVAHFVFTTHISGCLPTVYDIPHAQLNSRCVFTNTLPTGPYRGAGRPEASYLIERLIDAAADATGIDAAELRRRNLIAPDANSLHHRLRQHYDSGDFPAVFERALSACRLRRLCRAQEGGEEGRQAARHRHRLLSRDRRRLPGGSRAHQLSRRRQGAMSASAPAAAGRDIRPCFPRWRRAGSALRRRR